MARQTRHASAAGISSLPLSGDFSQDHVVDVAACILWRKCFGQTRSATGAGSLAIPQPANAALLVLAALGGLSRRIGRRFTHERIP